MVLLTVSYFREDNSFSHSITPVIAIQTILSRRYAKQCMINKDGDEIYEAPPPQESEMEEHGWRFIEEEQDASALVIEEGMICSHNEPFMQSNISHSTLVVGTIGKLPQKEDKYVQCILRELESSAKMKVDRLSKSQTP